MASPVPTPPLRIMILLALIAVGAMVLAGWRLLPREAAAAQVPAAIDVLDAGSPVTGLPEEAATEPAGAPPDGAEARFDVESAPAGRSATVTVHVAGPVMHPGVVVLPAGSRVTDAIAACGGLRPEAAAAAVNLARLLVDGERVDVDAPGEQGGPAQAAAGPTGSGKIDVNSATSEQLQELPGVGPVLAERLLAYRKEHGRFTSMDQLQEVPGIGARRMADLSDLVVLGSG